MLGERLNATADDVRAALRELKAAREAARQRIRDRVKEQRRLEAEEAAGETEAGGDDA